jgi:hypothetical protein
VVQIGPIRPILKPPGTKRPELTCDILPSTSAFTFKLRRYSKAKAESRRDAGKVSSLGGGVEVGERSHEYISGVPVMHRV